MTKPLRWRSQLCPCGYCPAGTRVEWRYSLDIRFRPKPRSKNQEVIVEAFLDPQLRRPRARTHDVRKALGGSQEGET